jgi:hypothetical protein
MSKIFDSTRKPKTGKVLDALKKDLMIDSRRKTKTEKMLDALKKDQRRRSVGDSGPSHGCASSGCSRCSSLPGASGLTDGMPLPLFESEPIEFPSMAKSQMERSSESDLQRLEGALVLDPDREDSFQQLMSSQFPSVAKSEEERSSDSDLKFLEGLLVLAPDREDSLQELMDSMSEYLFSKDV